MRIITVSRQFGSGGREVGERLAEILGWDYYSERCLEYLTGGKKTALTVFRWLYILAVLIGPFMTVAAVWKIADIFNGLMAIPNMIALFVLSGIAAKETRAFFDAGKHLNS